MSETTDVTFKPEAPATPAKPVAAAAPPRALPSDEDIAAWIHGADVPTLGAVFEGIDVKRFDALVMQVRKEELVPQHWQVLSSHAAPDDLVFNRLPEVGRLRVRYKDQELSRRRLQHLRYAWMEMGGRRLNIWTVADLLAAMRRIYEKKHPVDWTELLTAMRDIWRDSDLPFGREQLEILWACLVLIRKNTKK
ncbi:MAG TPA: hypothetical protein VH394_30120 [Thermoanaerobaculia bacterium]|jgi:hypothetical protein|nr:hypothetical protein [Thermoanaerobaculia bacterium]